MVFLKCYTTPLGVVAAGAKGFVKIVDETDGSLEILMEGLEPALVLWNNTLVLMPYDTEDLLDAIEFKRAPAVISRRLGDYLRLAAAFLLFR